MDGLARFEEELFGLKSMWATSERTRALWFIELS